MGHIVKLSTLQKGESFIIPGRTDELPTENTGSGMHYLYRVSRVYPDGARKIYNTDLKMYDIESGNKEVYKLTDSER